MILLARRPPGCFFFDFCRRLHFLACSSTSLLGTVITRLANSVKRWNGVGGGTRSGLAIGAILPWRSAHDNRGSPHRWLCGSGGYPVRVSALPVGHQHCPEELEP